MAAGDEARITRPGKFLPLDRVVVANDYPFHLELRNQIVTVKQIWIDGDTAIEFEKRHYRLNKMWLSHLKA